VKSTAADMSDGELARLALAGREDGYRRLLERHREPVFRLVRSLVGDGDAALDITQEAFVAGFAALKRYDPERPFRAWMSRIAVNKARDWARRRKVCNFFSRAADIDDAVAVADDAPRSDAILADRIELARAMKAIAILPHNLREVLVLRTIEDVPEAEAASILGISGKAVETRLYRARKQLSDLLNET
jgi:RNA polymerase sigma-70 factor (ECF subfamily)